MGPTQHAETATATRTAALAGGGEMGALVRAKDWSETPIGPIETWPQSLLTTVSTCLSSRFPILIWWGAEHVKIYNDAYRPMLGSKHPRALGQRGQDCWPEIWPIIGPMLDGVLRRGEATWSENQLLLLERHGFQEECYFTFSYSPIRDESGGVGGIFSAVKETTREVIGERRLGLLRALAEKTAGARTPEAACALAMEALAADPEDLPLAVLYRVSPDGASAQRAVSTGAELGWPETLDPGDEATPLARSAWRGVAELVTLSPKEGESGAPSSALVLPIGRAGGSGLEAILVAGLSRRLVFDAQYRSFLELVAGQVATAVAAGRALDDAERRATALAELDRAKTTFFSNVSHEFRTPLTLMLGPTQDALAGPDPALRGADLDTVHRNALRLLKLVNTLLDFARIEAGRVDASYEPTDLALATADLASAFRSAAERAGLFLEVDCPTLAEPVFVDRSMWEKIVLNLLSNALKHTFEGGISVSLRVEGPAVRLTVKDTGVGIPPQEVPRLFERFHRVEGARARTHEGSGIGLALVRDLVAFHGGAIEVESRVDEGTSFVVSVPLGRAHLPSDRVEAPRALVSTAVHADAYALEALRWMADPGVGTSPPGSVTTASGCGVSPPGPTTARVLVADDNADMRDYLVRLLRPHFRVDAVGDGLAALAAARRDPPDLVVSDVMMPGLDGLALARELRAGPATAELPILLLSARAGEEASAEGLRAGADDYLMKPFSAGALLLRVEAQLAMARTRLATRAAAEEARVVVERALAEAEAARAEAESANRTKDEFLAMLGHELRNPLAPILTAVHLMRLRGDDAGSKERTVIERQVRNLVRLVDDLLDVSRIAQGRVDLRRERIELAEVVARAIEMASPLLEEREHDLRVELPRHGLMVDCDPARLAQVFSNLLTNAAKYTDRRGRIELTGTHDRAGVSVTVKDSGVGIDAEMLPKVFDLFVQERQTIERSRGGLGLGLTIVRSLARMHGGTVVARSAGKGHGSEFTVWLPLAAGTADIAGADRNALAPPSIARRQGRRVLVVDDNEDAAELMADYLRSLRDTVRIAHDGPSAIQLARTLQPEVALVDIGLPVMDGYEVALRLREQQDGGGRLALIAVTGYGQECDRKRTREAGFDAHLVKPLDLDHLREVLEGVCGAPASR